MASVTLVFLEPDASGLAALIVYESTTGHDPWVSIDRTTAIGAYPDYINSFTTNQATSSTNWFAIAWEDVNGVIGSRSEGMQGGTTTLLAEVVKVATERAPSLEPEMVAQIAEDVIWYYAHVDPMEPRPPGMTDLYVTGLAYMTLAQALPFQTFATSVAGGSADAWVAGLVSVKKSSATSTSASGQGALEKLVEWLEMMGLRYMGMSKSRILQMKRITASTGGRQAVDYDVTRSLIEIEVGQ